MKERAKEDAERKKQRKNQREKQQTIKAEKRKGEKVHITNMNK